MGWGAIGSLAAQAVGSYLANKNNSSSTPATTQPSTLQKGSSGNFWSSPAAAGLISGAMQGVGGMLSGAGQNKSQESQLAQQLANSEAERAQQQKQFEAEMAFKQQQAALESTQLDPLAQQKSRQQNALKNAITLGAQNIQAPPGMEGFMPSGGLSIPAGGWSPEIQQMLSLGASQGAEQQFYNQAGQSPDLSTFYQPKSATPTVAPSSKPSWYESNLAKAGASNSALSAALGGESTIEKTRKRKWLEKAVKSSQNLGGR